MECFLEGEWSVRTKTERDVGEELTGEAELGAIASAKKGDLTRRA